MINYCIVRFLVLVTLTGKADSKSNLTNSLKQETAGKDNDS